MSEQAMLRMEEHGDVVVAHVEGELDLAVTQRIGDRIGEAIPTSARGLVIDLCDLGFIDSSGVALLFTLAQRLSGRRQELRVVVSPGSPVARVLELVDFGRAAPVGSDLDGALASVAG